MLILYNATHYELREHQRSRNWTQLIKVIVLQKLMLMTRSTTNFTRIPPQQEITWPVLDSLSQKTGKETRVSKESLNFFLLLIRSSHEILKFSLL